jgi:hypothetical protein
LTAALEVATSQAYSLARRPVARLARCTLAKLVVQLAPGVAGAAGAGFCQRVTGNWQIVTGRITMSR